MYMTACYTYVKVFLKAAKKHSKNVIFKFLLSPVLAVKTVRPPAPDELLISPLTGEKIPATKVQEHMRIGLLDPRWVEQRDRQIQDKINQETVYAPGICHSICRDLIAYPECLWLGYPEQLRDPASLVSKFGCPGIK